MRTPAVAAMAGLTLVLGCAHSGAPRVPMPNTRLPQGDDELRFWLDNMVRHHRFTPEEVRAATGLGHDEIANALLRLGIRSEAATPTPNGRLRTLPYPGGRHPRIGFLDGAVDPQRETKVSVFTPWNDGSHVVIDVPEAIWSDLGLTYLAHTHIPTVWTARGIELEPLEWRRRADGGLEIERRLPNGIEFGVDVIAGPRTVVMDLWLRNGTPQRLTDLRAQVCVLLRGAAGFAQQTRDNKVLSEPFAACSSERGDRWIITAWQPCHRVWENAPCPCVHSDPRLDDCEPGQTVRARGWLTFYSGTDIEAELRRLAAEGLEQAWTPR